MTIKEWTIENPRRVIRLEHAYISGRATILVDETTVFQREATYVDYGFDHEFTVENSRCCVRVRPRGFGFQYELKIDDEIPESLLSPAATRQTGSSRTALMIGFCLFGILFVASALRTQGAEQVMYVAVAVSNFAMALHLLLKTPATHGNQAEYAGDISDGIDHEPTWQSPR